MVSNVNYLCLKPWRRPYLQSNLPVTANIIRGTLPENLKEALDELQNDEVICDILGPHLLQRFIDAKRMEWEDYRIQVSSWELGHYLTSY